jgi:hypothetical protein
VIGKEDQMNPFTGSWTANLEKSRRHANHQFASATMTFDVTDQAVSMAYSGVNAAGREESSALEFYPDGMEHPVSPQAPGVMMVCTWEGTHRLNTEARKGDVVLGRGSYEVSPDGSILTATISGIDASGATVEQVIVFDRR